jgi:hypothetical protein
MWIKLLGYFPDASWQPLRWLLNHSETKRVVCMLH